jgi:hypothetical protein
VVFVLDEEICISTPDSASDRAQSDTGPTGEEIAEAAEHTLIEYFDVIFDECLRSAIDQVVVEDHGKVRLPMRP